MPTITIEPLTPDRWGDFETLFGARGACGGCWCMYFRLTAREFEANKGDPNRWAMHRLVQEGVVPGLLAYVDGQPAGWCAVAPRADYSRLARSRILAPVDDQPVWSIVCFFVARAHRRQGLTSRLLRAAADFARAQGAAILEGYPEIPRLEKAPDVFLYVGIASAFEKAGFAEVARRSPHRPIMRLDLMET